LSDEKQRGICIAIQFAELSQAQQAAADMINQTIRWRRISKKIAVEIFRLFQFSSLPSHTRAQMNGPDLRPVVEICFSCYLERDIGQADRCSQNINL
jgi:hypothetical protein